jgi:hypothetical protein
MTKLKKIPCAAVFFAFALFLFTWMRLEQYTTVIRTDNGFFEHDGGAMNSVYYAIFGVAAALFLVFSLLDKSEKRGIVKGKSAGTNLSPAAVLVGTVLAGVCGVCFGVEAYSSFLDKTAPFPVILMILAAVSYTFVAYSVASHKKITAVVSIAFLFIAGNYVCNAAILFRERIYVASISLCLIMLTANLLLAVFFLNCGRIIVRSASRLTDIFAVISGYLAALLVLSDGAARFIYYFTASDEVRTQLDLYSKANAFELPTPLYMTQAAAVLWFIFALSMKKGGETEEAADEEEPKESEEREELLPRENDDKKSEEESEKAEEFGNEQQKYEEDTTESAQD